MTFKSFFIAAMLITPLTVFVPAYALTLSFAPQVSYPAGAESLSVAIGDLNGDGKSDVVTLNRFENKVSVLFGSRAGH